MSLFNPDNAILYIVMWAASILAALTCCFWMIKNAKNPNTTISGGLFFFFVTGGIAALLSFNLSTALELIFKLSNIQAIIELCVVLICLIVVVSAALKIKKIGSSTPIL